MNHLNIAARVIDFEAKALESLHQHLTDNLSLVFNNLVDHLLASQGRIILTGLGKSGHIARKIAASFSSTGNAAYFLHPVEASHGDLGMISPHDLVIILSNSGENKELFDIIDYCKKFAIKIVGITMNINSTLANHSDFLLSLPKMLEVSNIIAPAASTIMMLAMGDALMTALHEAKNLSKGDYQIFHPGGKIGSNLTQISDLMMVQNELPLVLSNDSIELVISNMNDKKLGCAIVTDEHNHLVGIITNSDFRRNLQKINAATLAKDIMTAEPRYITDQISSSEALTIFNNYAISVLPVIKDKLVIGLLHIQALLKARVS